MVTIINELQKEARKYIPPKVLYGNLCHQDFDSHLSLILSKDKPLEEKYLYRQFKYTLESANEYIALQWPEIQEYMESSRWNEVGYDPKKDLWFVPKDMIR